MNSYALWKDNLLKVGNEQIERAVRLDGALPHNEYILDKLAGKRWESSCPTAMFNVELPNGHVILAHIEHRVRERLRHRTFNLNDVLL